MSEQSYVVVVNDEEQYSIWPAHRDLPAGWAVRSGPADRQSCLDHVAEHWVDMRPRGLRERTAS
ncbi:MbtH family protein [Actinokineospora sp. G85]|uniref:MbtH family protein n=1 Tax=Actinokineospora sp. G85 TaxID=3406626 RepID=UPI003C79575D